MRRLHDIPQERQIIDHKIFGKNGSIYLTPTPTQYGNVLFSAVDWSPELGQQIHISSNIYDINAAITDVIIENNGTFNVTWEYNETA